MLAKLNRLTKKDIDLLFKKGDIFRTPYIIIRSQKSDQPAPRFAILFAKSAKLESVGRNRLRRQTYSSIREVLPDLPIGRDYGILLSAKYIAMNDAEKREVLMPVLRKLIPIR